ncbi:hypothetical protein CAPTEDRAFT_224194 [Capitella teleta]|uniref:Uncharacterized protein n=1 Tax=Capitella teleta TaxID=283909 RepID=R7UBQ1_CAPTE|nr:hypothetical protein CAPTEDRAFT_224194 [Capitella teleta]|eukprot:ELU00697.1 hypothetical protein CAPTEDRAFT_224194 [Capitella teleta]
MASRRTLSLFGSEPPAIRYSSAENSDSPTYVLQEPIAAIPDLPMPLGSCGDREKLKSLEPKAQKWDLKRVLSLNNRGLLEHIETEVETRELNNRLREDVFGMPRGNCFRPLGTRNNNVGHNLPPKTQNPFLRRDSGEFVATGTYWSPIGAPSGRISVNSRPTSRTSQISSTQLNVQKKLTTKSHVNSIPRHRGQKEEEPKYADPLINAPPSLNQRVSEMASLEADSLRWEKARKFKRKSKSYAMMLKLLQCPYTEAVDDAWIAELLFTAHEPRMRLLQWLFSRFHARLNEVVDPSFYSSESRMDSVLHRLLFTASTLGLCGPSEVEVIKGSAPVQRQAAFWDQLLDLVCVIDASHDPQKNIMQSPGFIGEGTGLHQQFLADCQLVDDLVDQENVDQVFQIEAKVLPPDISRMIEQKTKPEERIPDSAQLTEMLQELKEDLRRQEDMLHELKQDHPSSTSSSDDKLQRTLQLVFSELSQLISGFSCSYDNDIQQWCNKTPPQLSQLGQSFKKVHALSQLFSTMLNQLKKIRGNYSQISSDMKSSIHRLRDQKLSLGSDLHSALANFQISAEILEDSICRQGEEVTSRNTTLESLKTPVVKFN